MRRRFLALLCAMTLCLALLAPSHAAGEVCFTAVNITVLPLTADSMPVWSGGTLYVPYTVFDANSTGVSLGTGSIYSKSSGTVRVFSVSQILVFDLNEGNCYNQHTGERMSGRAIMRNGKPYLPAARVCSFFGLNPPSYLSTPYGYLVRITNGDASNKRYYTDAMFIEAGGDVLRDRLRDYNQSIAPVEDPAAPSTQQPAASSGPEPGAATIPTYLAFRCQTGQAGQAIADTLDQNAAAGLFFFPVEEIGRQGGLIRRLLGSGHSVGILAEGDNLAQTQELLQAGRQALEAVCHTRTYFALVPEDQRQALEVDGWVCWNSSVDAIPDGSRTPYNHAAGTVRALPKKGSVNITLDDSQATADAMTYLLRQLKDKQYTITIPRETRL